MPQTAFRLSRRVDGPAAVRKGDRFALPLRQSAGPNVLRREASWTDTVPRATSYSVKDCSARVSAAGRRHSPSPRVRHRFALAHGAERHQARPRCPVGEGSPRRCVRGRSVPSRSTGWLASSGQCVALASAFDETAARSATSSRRQTWCRHARRARPRLGSSAGPTDPDSAKFYEADGIHLKTGKTEAVGGIPREAGVSTFREAAGSTVAAKQKAIIPDPRNDENLAVTQARLAFIRFHNRVVDTLPARVPRRGRFQKAREKVIKHYQWMLRTDFLPRICAPTVVNDGVHERTQGIRGRGFRPRTSRRCPSSSRWRGYRLGHSMIRSAYNWNRDFDAGSGTLDLLFEFSGGSGTFNGGTNPPATGWWTSGVSTTSTEAGRADLAVPAAKFNRARRIDTSIANLLAALPGFTADEANLAFRNLARARMVRLATGQQMVTFLPKQGRDAPDQARGRAG